MRKPVLLIFTNACILIVVFVFLTQSLFVVQRVAVARSVSGQVTVQRGGSGALEPLSVGADIKSGDIVRTGAGSEAEFAWKDGTRWTLLPVSQLVIEKALLNPPKKTENSQFRLDSGQVLMRVVRSMAPASRFAIETPYAVALVRGTIFSVSVDKNSTEVKVFRGEVEVFSSNRAEKRSIGSGQKVRASLLGSKTVADADYSDFLARPAFLKPELQVEVRQLDDNKVLLTGQTEVGNAVTIDGIKVRVLGTGSFVKRVKIGSKNAAWKIESTDKHGGQSVVWQRLPAPYQQCETP